MNTHPKQMWIGVLLVVLWTASACTSINTELKLPSTAQTTQPLSPDTKLVVVYKIGKSKSGRKIGLGFSKAHESVKKAVYDVCTQKLRKEPSEALDETLRIDTANVHEQFKTLRKDTRWVVEGNVPRKIELFRAFDIQTQLEQPESGRYKALGILKTEYEGRHRKEKTMQATDVGEKIISQGEGMNADLAFVYYSWGLRGGKKKSSYKKLWIGSFAHYYTIDCTEPAVGTALSADVKE